MSTRIEHLMKALRDLPYEDMVEVATALSRKLGDSRHEEVFKYADALEAQAREIEEKDGQRTREHNILVRENREQAARLAEAERDAARGNALLRDIYSYAEDQGMETLMDMIDAADSADECKDERDERIAFLEDAVRGAQVSASLFVEQINALRAEADAWKLQWEQCSERYQDYVLQLAEARRAVSDQQSAEDGK